MGCAAAVGGVAAAGWLGVAFAVVAGAPLAPVGVAVGDALGSGRSSGARQAPTSATSATTHMQRTCAIACLLGAVTIGIDTTLSR